MKAPLSGLAFVTFTLTFTANVFAKNIAEDYFELELEDSLELDLEDSLELDLQDSLELPKEQFSEEKVQNGPLSLANKRIPIWDLLGSSLTLGNFNGNVAGIRLLENTLTLNLSTSTNIPSVGYVDFSGNIGIWSENEKLNNELMLFTIQNSFSNIHWKLGKFRKSWGDVDGSLVLDVINPSETILGKKLPGMELSSRWLTEVTFFNGKNTSEFFTSFSTDTLHSGTAGSKMSGFEIGLKSSYDTEKGQISLYLASLYPRTGVINIASGLSHSNRFKLVGFSVQKELRNFLLNFDLAQKIDLNRSTLNDFITCNRIDGAASLEYAPTPYEKWFFKLESSIWEDSLEPYYIYNSSALIRDENQKLNYNLAYSKNTADEKFNSTLSLGGNGNGKTFYLSGESTYSVSDSTKLKANFLFLNTQDNDLNFFSSNSNWINFGVTRHF